jgi:hypothetical protein
MKDSHFLEKQLFLVLDRVVPLVEENNSEKNNFWQRFRAKKKTKTPVQAVTLRSLVNKMINVLLLSDHFFIL